MLVSDVNKMSDDEKAKIVSVSLKPEVIRELDSLAESWGTSRSGMISILVKMNQREIENNMSDYAEEVVFFEKMRKDYGVKRKNRI